MARRNPVTAKDMFGIALDALKEKRTADAKAVTKEASEKFPNATVPGALQRFLPPQYDIDKLAVDLGLPTWESVEERNLDYIWDAADQRIDATGDEDADDEARLDMEGEVQDELFCDWYDAVLATGQSLLHSVQLQIAPIRRGRHKRVANSREFYLQVTPLDPKSPAAGWKLAAEAMLELENGIGPVFSTYRDWLGSDTPKEAVMKCIYYLRRYHEVYGGPSARTLYDQNWR